MAILSNKAKVSDFVDVLRAVKARNGVVARDALVMYVFNVHPSDENFRHYCKRIENVARASKDDSNPNNAELYQEVYGQAGSLQSIIENGVSYYRHIPAIEGVKKCTYNPNNIEDVRRLVPLVLSNIPKHEGINFSISDMAFKLAMCEGYTMGSIAPSIGTIQAELRRNPDSINDADALAELIFEKLGNRGRNKASDQEDQDNI